MKRLDPTYEVLVFDKDNKVIERFYVDTLSEAKIMRAEKQKLGFKTKYDSTWKSVEIPESDMLQGLRQQVEEDK